MYESQVGTTFNTFFMFHRMAEAGFLDEGIFELGALGEFVGAFAVVGCSFRYSSIYTQRYSVIIRLVNSSS